MVREAAAAAGAAAFLAAILAAGLRPDAFFSGDPGVKYIAARDALKHPERPFELDYPLIDGRPVPYTDPFFLPHDDHGHPLQSPLFPVASAPLIGALGPRGAYVLPALGFILLVLLVEAFRARVLPNVPAWAVAIPALVANPVFFYAFEFWEHAPAVALAAGATLCAWRPSNGASLAAGALGGLAILLRTEAAWYVLALLATAPMGGPRRLWMGGGLALSLMPAGAANYAHFGEPLGPYLRANMNVDTAWPADQAAIALHWFGAQSPVPLSGFALIAAGWMAALLKQPAPRRELPALAGALLVAGSAAYGLFPRESLWQAWPAGALALVPHHAAGAVRLRTLAAVSLAAVVLTARIDGGAQWGPRFALIASPALVLLTGIAVASLTAAGRQRRALKTLLVIGVLLCGAAVSRLAYRELRGAKRDYGAIVDATKQWVPPGGVVVTDVWWFGQITAVLHDHHTLLVASDRAPLAALVDGLERARIPAFVLAQSIEQGPAMSGRLGCYEPGAPRLVPVRGVVLTPFTWTCP